MNWYKQNSVQIVFDVIQLLKDDSIATQSKDLALASELNWFDSILWRRYYETDRQIDR